MGWDLLEGSASAGAGQGRQHTQQPLGADTTSLEYLPASREPIPWDLPKKRWRLELLGRSEEIPYLKQEQIPHFTKARFYCPALQDFPHEWMAAGYCAQSEAALFPHVVLKRGFHYSCYFQSFVEENVCGLNVLLEDMKDLV